MCEIKEVIMYEVAGETFADKKQALRHTAELKIARMIHDRTFGDDSSFNGRISTVASEIASHIAEMFSYYSESGEAPKIVAEAWTIWQETHSKVQS
jgi:hypothetical protein